MRNGDGAWWQKPSRQVAPVAELSFSFFIGQIAHPTKDSDFTLNVWKIVTNTRILGKRVRSIIS